MIMSIAQAPVDEASHVNVFGAWSDLIVGERPTGLVDCYLLEADGVVQVAAVWRSIDDHDHEERNPEQHHERQRSLRSHRVSRRWPTPPAMIVQEPGPDERESESESESEQGERRIG